MIAKMGLMAIAFSSQLLPMALDVLFFRKGTGAGAAWGLAAGLFAAFLFSPLFTILFDTLGKPDFMAPLTLFVDNAKGLLKLDGVMYGVHGSVWGLALNVPIFIIVSLITRRVPKERKAEFAAVMRGEKTDEKKPASDDPPAKQGWAS
jgi:Na+/proline symporter